VKRAERKEAVLAGRGKHPQEGENFTVELSSLNPRDSLDSFDIVFDIELFGAAPTPLTATRGSWHVATLSRS
jgi:hypothetical protein